MRRRLHPDALLLAAALAGALALALLARAEPDLVPLSDAPSREGDRVAVEGRVLDSVRGERGRHLVLADAGHRLDVLAGPGEAPARGATARAVGVVARTPDGWVVSAESVEILAPPGARVLSPAEVAAEPRAFEGARVSVRGLAQDGAIAGGGARLRLAGEPPPEWGAPWIAAGLVEYRPRDAAFTLRVDAWSPPS